MAEKEIKDIELDEDAQVYFGGAIKATQLDDGNVKLAGYLVRFGDETQKDLYTEWFTPQTDFGPAQKSIGWFNHRMPVYAGETKAKAYRKSLGEATLKQDEAGVWAEIILDARNAYEEMIAEMGLKGKLGWSSGTAPHLVDKKASGEITRWMLGLDASLTPTPAEPRNSVIPLKSLMSDTTAEEEGAQIEAEAGDQPAADDDAEPETAQKSSKGKIAMYKTRKEALEAYAKSAGIENVADLTRDQILYALKGTEWEGEAPAEPMFSKEEIKTIMKEAAVEATKAALAAAPAIEPDVSVTTDEGDQGWESDGHFFKAVMEAGRNGGIVDPRLRSEVKAGTGINEAVPSDGGFLLKDTVADGIQSNMWNTGEILSRVSPDQVGPNSNRMTFNAVDETSRLDGSRRGGILGYWTAEGSTITNSKPKFRQIDLTLKKVAALVFATEEQVMDTTFLTGWLQREVPMELRFKVEDAIYNGNGVGKPLGIMASNALVSVTRINASTITPRDISNMWSRRYAGVNDYVWFANQDIHPVLENMTITNEVYQPPGAFASSPNSRLYGRELIDVEYAATLGTTGDLMLASMSQYAMIEKAGVRSAESIHVRFEYDERVFKFTYRVDGEPQWASPVTPFKGTNTVSPFVVMSTSSA
jgi:HK97 family phage major capsid protein